MRVPIRLYKRHDLDLIYLYKHQEFSLVKAMKVALYGYIHHERFFINTPTDDVSVNGLVITPAYDEDKNNKRTNKSQKDNKEKCKIKEKPVFFSLNLNENYDKDIIKFIKNMPSGYRNSLIKNIVRTYFYGPNIFGYYINNECAINDHKVKETNNLSYKLTDTYKYYKTTQAKETTVNIIDIYRSKKYIRNNKKKYNTDNIPIEELADAVLEDKIYDQEYLKQFEPEEKKKDHQNEISDNPNPDNHKQEKTEKIKTETYDNLQNKNNEDEIKEEEYITPDYPEEDDEEDDFDFFANLENMMEKGGFL